MKSATQWGIEAAEKFRGTTPEHRAAIEAVVARIVRHVRREMDAESAEAVERLERIRREVNR